MVQRELSFQDISYLELWRLSRSALRNRLGNFGQGHYEEHFCGVILNLDHWSRRICLK